MKRSKDKKPISVPMECKLLNEIESYCNRHKINRVDAVKEFCRSGLGLMPTSENGSNGEADNTKEVQRKRNSRGSGKGRWFRPYPPNRHK